MKVIIAGSRNLSDRKTVDEAIKASNFTVTEVVSGGARGVDRLGEAWAADRQIPVTQFLAKWDVYGKSAGPVRNKQMANYADALIAVWDGISAGTRNMIDQAKDRGLHVYVQIVGRSKSKEND